MFLADERWELAQWPARGRFSRPHIIRMAVEVFHGLVSLDIREWYQEKGSEEWKATRKGIKVTLAEVEHVQFGLTEYMDTLRKMGLDRVGLRANGTSPRQLNKAPRQNLTQREREVAQRERDAEELKKTAMELLARARGENVIDVRGRIEAKNAPQKGEEAA